LSLLDILSKPLPSYPIHMIRALRSRCLKLEAL
jgi:hypothetical protein